jgi:hypothetical protein
MPYLADQLTNVMVDTLENGNQGGNNRPYEKKNQIANYKLQTLGEGTKDPNQSSKIVYKK